MKIRSQSELQDALDQSFAARKRELTTLRFMVLRCKREHEKQALLRAIVPMLYAHWEGFIRLAATAYLEYISRRSGKAKDFQVNFLALTCRDKILKLGGSKKIVLHTELIEYILMQLDRPVDFNANDMIDTQSNLSSETLREIMVAVGLPFDTYWQKKERIIDNMLLKVRNEIAHGHLAIVDETEFEQLYNLVLESLENFKSAIENAATLETYRKPDTADE